jgi:hypothetical protein
LADSRDGNLFWLRPKAQRAGSRSARSKINHQQLEVKNRPGDRFRARDNFAGR